MNNNCESAKMYAVANHHDPGILTVPARLNEFTTVGAVAAAYGVLDAEVDDIISPAPVFGRAQSLSCLKMCERD
jgi:hypothetical protein